MPLGFGFGLDGGEELSCHHLHRSLKHALAHACDSPAHLDVAVITHHGGAVPFIEIQVSRSFQEPRLALAVDRHAKVTWRLQVFKAHVTGEHSFDRPDSRANRGRVGIVAGLFQSFTTGNASLKDHRIDKRLIYALAARMEFVGAFDLHGCSMFRVSGFGFRLLVLTPNGFW